MRRLQGGDFLEDSKLRGMRHIKPSDHFSWVPVEEVLRVVTVLHAADVKYGEFTSVLADVAVVTVGDSENWVLLPTTNHNNSTQQSSNGSHHWHHKRRKRPST
jgi:hypothetical protein